MRKRQSIVIYCLLGVLLGAFLSCAGAAPNPVDQLPPATITDLRPEEKHANLDQTIAGLLTHYHYRQNDLNDELSAAVLDAYLQALDFNRSFFLAGDIAQFKSKYQLKIDNYLQAGNLDPAYEIFNLYQRRLARRTARLRILLQRPVNFDLNESVELDRENVPWASTQQELDEIWRKRIKHELLTLVLEDHSLEDAKETLLRRYEGRLRRTSQYTSEDVFQLYMNAVAASFDPHTAYFSPRTSENFNIQMRLSLEGIGTVLRMEEEQIMVVELVPGGPADLSRQLFPNDKIVGVGQGRDGEILDIVGWRLDDVVDLIRGPRGTVVRLRVISADAGPNTPNKIVQLVRDTIKLEKQAAQSELKTIPGENGELKIGVITIPTFYSDFAAAQSGQSDYRSTTRDVRHLVADFKNQGVDGLVIDLRQNGGGSLQEAVALTGLFIEQGPVVQVRNSRGNIEIETDPDPDVFYDGPMAVLVNRYSASASEIFAGAMQDYGRAVIIGSPTFGKGTVQTLIDLNRFMPRDKGELGQLKLTIAKFYRVTGSSTQHRGVIPDIEFPSLFDDDEVGESSQDFALPWDEIRAIDYRGSRLLDSFMHDLVRKHNQRMDNDPAYRQLLEDITTAQQLRAKTRVSLLKSQREAEREQEQKLLRERENRRRLAMGLKPLAEDEALPTEEDDEENAPDLMLDESLHVLADMISFIDHRTDGARLVMTDG